MLSLSEFHAPAALSCNLPPYTYIFGKSRCCCRCPPAIPASAPCNTTVSAASMPQMQTNFGPLNMCILLSYARLAFVGLQTCTAYTQLYWCISATQNASTQTIAYSGVVGKDTALLFSKRLNQTVALDTMLSGI